MFNWPLREREGELPRSGNRTLPLKIDSKKLLAEKNNDKLMIRNESILRKNVKANWRSVSHLLVTCSHNIIMNSGIMPSAW